MGNDVKELFKDYLPPGQTMKHHMEKVQWNVARSAEEVEAIIWWFGSEARVFKTVSDFQPDLRPLLLKRVAECGVGRSRS